MTSSTSKLVAVVGGTGSETSLNLIYIIKANFDIGILGSSVARSLARNPEFEVRALSRDAQGPKAQRLSGEGITVVSANNWDAQALEVAFQGCWAVFINIDSDNPVRHGRTAPNALKSNRACA